MILPLIAGILIVMKMQKMRWKNNIKIKRFRELRSSRNVMNPKELSVNKQQLPARLILVQTILIV